jgi:hypothetical protein
MAEAIPAPSREFSLTAGGPFHHFARRHGLLTQSGALRVWWLAAFAWLPLAADAAVRALAGARFDPILSDISVHVRFLIALPLLGMADRVVTEACRLAVHGMYDGAIAERPALDRLIDGAERMRDNPWVERGLAILAVINGQLALWGVTNAAGLVGGTEESVTSVARLWYAGIALPVVNFLLARWLWRWAIWTVVLVRLSRLPLATIATHPDRAAGLRFLVGPVAGFAAFELAFATILSGAWGTQLIAGRLTVPALGPTLLLFLILVLAVALAPLFLFCAHIYRAQRAAVVAYHPLAFEYVRRFHAKWIARPPDPSLLGTSDIQSLADLANSYDVVQGTRAIVVRTRDLLVLVLAAIVPVLPLVATVVPVDQWLTRLASALFGGVFR